MIKHRVKVCGNKKGWVILADDKTLIGYCWYDPFVASMGDIAWSWETIGAYPMYGVSRTRKEAIEQMIASSNN
jgi:hypothetical protein